MTLRIINDHYVLPTDAPGKLQALFPQVKTARVQGQWNNIEYARLKKLLLYDPDTGIFTWACGGSGRRKGCTAGGVHSTGYVHIKLDGVTYKAHRLAVLYMEGYMPEHTVDHINRVRSDNRYCNLREASYQCQSRNSAKKSRNTSEVVGVRWRAQRKRWQASIMVTGKMFYLGHYTNLIDAAYARYAAEQCLGFQEWDNNSSAKQYIERYV